MTPKTADFSHIFPAVFLAQEQRNGGFPPYFGILSAVVSGVDRRDAEVKCLHTSNY